MPRYAVLISAEEYVHFSRTAFCHADAHLLLETLTKECDYDAKHVLHLALRPDLDETPRSILESVSKTVEGSTQGDTILFYFAGHGHKAKNGKTYLIVPTSVPDLFEETAIQLDDISDLLRRNDRICVRLFDACHSGADVRAPGGVDASGFIRDVTHDSSGWLTLAACREDQSSISDPALGQGVFTYYLAQYISSLANGDEVLPELLKINIVQKIIDHSARLGFQQTPTLNASISGNVSVATRRVRASVTDAVSPNFEQLKASIRRLTEVPDIVTTSYLSEALVSLKTVFESTMSNRSLPISPFKAGPVIRSSMIPAGMQKPVVQFAIRQSLVSRHSFERTENNTNPWASTGIGMYFGAERDVSYSTFQVDSLPESAVVLSAKGDGRCVPDVEVLLYVIPLQLSVCLLISAFARGWPPDTEEVHLLCHTYGTLKPGEGASSNGNLALTAAKHISNKLRDLIERRVAQLERELKQ